MRTLILLLAVAGGTLLAQTPEKGTPDKVPSVKDQLSDQDKKDIAKYGALTTEEKLSIREVESAMLQLNIQYKQAMDAIRDMNDKITPATEAFKDAIKKVLAAHKCPDPECTMDGKLIIRDASPAAKPKDQPAVEQKKDGK